jgi:thioredoxin-like negative regulator of GroEL
VELGKPVAHFNTRIPEKMAELLDDLVYKLRKKGEQKTKQDLDQEALHELLIKHSIC